jgi:hypothetical protein
MEIGDKVRTNELWNKHNDQISSVIVGFDVLLSPKTKLLGDYYLFTGEYDHISVVVLETGRKIREMYLVKVV